MSAGNKMADMTLLQLECGQSIERDVVSKKAIISSTSIIRKNKNLSFDPRHEKACL
jgi:hypothetical protein